MDLQHSVGQHCCHSSSSDGESSSAGDSQRTGNCPSPGRGASKPSGLQERRWQKLQKVASPWSNMGLSDRCGEMKPVSSVHLVWHQWVCAGCLCLAISWPREQPAPWQECRRRKQLCIPTVRSPGAEALKVLRNAGCPGTAEPADSCVPRCSKSSCKSYGEATGKKSWCSVFSVQFQVGSFWLLHRKVIYYLNLKVYLASVPGNVYAEVHTSWKPLAGAWA